MLSTAQGWTATAVTGDEPVSVAALRTHVRVTDNESDAELEAFGLAAREWLEVRTDRQLVERTTTIQFDGFPDDGGDLVLPVAPVSAVTSVQYVDANGVTQTLAPSVYVVQLNAATPRLRLAYAQGWPITRTQPLAVTVVVTSGPATADDVLARAQQAIKLLVGHWYSNRETVVVGVMATDVPFAVDMIATSLTRVSV